MFFHISFSCLTLDANPTFMPNKPTQCLLDCSGFTYLLQGQPNNFFFENTAEYFLKFLFFYLKIQSYRLIMENNFIQMTASGRSNFLVRHRLWAAVFHQWLHEYCPLWHQLSLLVAVTLSLTAPHQ